MNAAAAEWKPTEKIVIILQTSLQVNYSHFTCTSADSKSCNPQTRIKDLELAVCHAEISSCETWFSFQWLTYWLVKPSLALALMSTVSVNILSPPQGSPKETKNKLEAIPGSALRTASVQTRTIQVMSVIQALPIYLGSNVVKPKKAGIWTCLVTLEMNKAIGLLHAEGKKEKKPTTVSIALRRHGKESQKRQKRSTW